MIVETNLVKHINGYLSRWDSIETLRDLENHELRKFWEELEILVQDVCLELKNIAELDSVFTPVTTLIVKPDETDHYTS